MLCVDLQGWDMGGSEREAQEGGDICIFIADSCCTCKAITCKFKKIIARQAPLFVEFSRQEYWSGLPFSTPGDLPEYFPF